MIKKILSLFIALSCIFSSMGALAAEPGYSDLEMQRQAISLMVSLGVMEDTALDEPTAYVTRAEAAHYISSLAVSQIPSEPRSIFADVGADHDYAADITLLTDLGIINSSALNFRPDDYITGFEFIKMIVCMIDREFVAEELGGYPAGYIRVAQQNKLLGGLSFSTNQVTVGEFAVVLYESLECKYVNYNEYYTFDTEGDTYMYSMLGLDKCSGVVTDNAVSSLNGASALDENQFTVNGITFYADRDYGDLLGYYVDVYYRPADRVKNAYKTVSVMKDPSYTDIINVMYDDIKSFEANTYTYYDESGKEKSVSLASDAVVIYNGIALTAQQYIDNPDIYIPTYGTVELISNNSSKDIELVKVKNYRNMVVSSYNTESLSVYGYEEVTPLYLEDADYVIRDKDGAVADFAVAVSTGNVLMIAESLDKAYAEIIYTKDTVEGKVTEVNSGDDTFKINDALYMAAPDCADLPEFGTDGVYYVNAFNDVVYVQKGMADGFTVAYVIDAGSESGLKGGNMLRVYTHYDMLKTLAAADKISIDGNSYSGNSDKVKTIFEDNVDEIVLLKLNSQGEISVLDTPLDTSDDGIAPVDGLHHTGTRYHNNPGSTFAGKMFVTDNTYCFVVPQEMDEDQISIFKGSASYQRFLQGVQIEQEVAVYRYGNNDSVQVLALANKVGISGTQRGKGCPYLVTSISRAINSRGEESYKLGLNRNGTISEVYTAGLDDILYECDGKTYTIGKGDLILFGTDKYGFMSKGQLNEVNQVNKKLENITLVYNAKENWFNAGYTPEYYTDYSVDMNTKFCYIYDNTDLEGHYKVTFTDPSEVVSESNVIAYNFKNMRYILLYDSEHDIITSTTYNEFMSYKDVGSSCTKLVFFMNYLNNGGFCVVYK